MIVYWVMLVVVCFGAWFSDAHAIKRFVGGRIVTYPHWGGVLVALSAMVLVAGLRSGTNDTAAYILIFTENVPSTFSEMFATLLDGTEKGPSFFVYQTMIKICLADDFHFFLFITALISLICVVVTLRRCSTSMLLSLYLFITMGTFSWTMNGIRQFFAASILFFCIRWIIDGKWKHYFLTVAVLSTVHFTAAMMIPIYFFVRAKPWKGKSLIGIGLMLVAIVFFGGSMRLFFDVFENTDISGYEETINETPGANILRAILALVPVLMAFVLKKRIGLLKNKLINICVNFSIVNFLLMLLASRGGGLFLGRLCGFTELYLLILYPCLLGYIPLAKKSRKWAAGGLMGIYLCFYYYQMVVVWDSYYISDILFGPDVIQ